MVKNSIFLLIILVIAVQAQQVVDVYSKYALAQSYESSGEVQNAIKIYEELVQADPNNQQFFNSLNNAYLQVKNYAASVNILEDHLAKFPNDINSYGMLGSTYYVMGNEQKAFDVWDKALGMPGNNPVAYRIIGNFAIERRAFEKAIEIYEKGKAKSDDNLIYSFDLSRLYAITMQYEKAAEEYCYIVKTDPSQYQIVKTNIFSLLNKPDAAKKIITVFEDIESDNYTAIKRMLAELYTQVKDYEKAFDLFVELDKTESSQGTGLLNFARLLLSEKQFALSSNVFEKVISLYPGNTITPMAKLGYAKSIEAAMFEVYTNQLPLWKPEFHPGKYELPEVYEVINAFEEVAKLYQHTEAAYEALFRIGMINYNLLKKKDVAKENFKKIVTEAPLSKSSGEAYIELGNIELEYGSLEEAEKNYLQVSKVQTDEKTKNSAAFKLARINYFKGNNREAYKLVNTILSDLKDDFANDAISFSIILNNTRLDSSNGVLFAKAELLAEQKKFGEAADIYRQISNHKTAMLFQPVALYKLAEMEIAEDKFTAALETLGKIVEEGNKNMYSDRALFLMGKTYQYGLKDESKALELYKKLLAEFPNSILINEAREKIISLQNKLS